MGDLEHSLEDKGVCECAEEFRSACHGDADYEHEDKRYCILHLPSENKEDNFEKALRSKLERNDFRFAGVYFPRVNFNQATFNKWADFGGATFSARADFDRTTFESVNFLATTFGRGAYYFDATFRRMTNFARATFSERVHFSRLKTFDETTFGFRNVTTEKPEQVSFHTPYLRPSWFVDADAQKFDFSEVEWFRLPGGDKLNLEDEIEALKRREIQAPESLRKLAKACRGLMNNAEENRDFPTANEFHYWSMEAQRKEGWRRLGFIAALYWALSGYGERPRRAFWVLVAIWLTFAALYLLQMPRRSGSSRLPMFGKVSTTPDKH